MNEFCSIAVVDRVCQVGISLVSNPDWNINGIMEIFLFPFTVLIIGLLAARKYAAFWVILIIGIFEAFIGAARLADLNQIRPQDEGVMQVIRPVYAMIWQGLSLIVVAIIVLVFSIILSRRTTTPPSSSP